MTAHPFEPDDYANAAAIAALCAAGDTAAAFELAGDQPAAVHTTLVMLGLLAVIAQTEQLELDVDAIVATLQHLATRARLDATA